MMIGKCILPAAAGLWSVVLLTTPIMAADLHPATRAEIIRHLGPNAAGKPEANGFTYKQGSTKGYKVSNGSICIRSPDGSTACAKILTDGSKFKMVSANGARADF